MCGIAGYVLRSPQHPSPPLLARLLEGIRSRGPDDEGACLVHRQDGLVLHLRTDHTVPGTPVATRHLRDARDFPHDLALGGTRFAIQDPSPAAHQPFVSGDGSVVGVFNGEIYNFVELRHELERSGILFRTRSDTEVLIEGFRHWQQELWPRLNGFWAAALFDNARGTLTLSRDRLGIAPLYLRVTPEGTFFCSSLVPLRGIEPQAGSINTTAVIGFIETSLKDFDGATMFAGISSASPATTLVFNKGRAIPEEALSRSFWTPPEQRFRPGDLSLDEAVTQVRDTLVDAVTLRLRADVPTAFELSGGLDSSSIVAIAATLRPGITTFTIEVPSQNEEPYARAMRDHHKIDYRVLRAVEDSFPGRALEFARVMEEPYHSPNIFTHFEMRRRMKAEGVDVVLSGSGGDEVLAGYEELFWPRACQAIRSEGERLAVWRHSSMMHMRQLTSWQVIRARARKVHGRLRRLVTRHRPDTSARPLLTRESGGSSPAAELERRYPELPYDAQRRYHFQVGLLPYYLASNDRFTMAIPLEHRLPFLDYRMVELGLRLPPSYLFHNGWTKYVLRKAMAPFLPKAITWRRTKMGFPFPHADFLRAQRAVFEPYLSTCVRLGVLSSGMHSYDDTLQTDPVKLWRACSTGLWLESL